MNRLRFFVGNLLLLTAIAGAESAPQGVRRASLDKSATARNGKFWSFVKPTQSPPPTVKNPQWAHTPIDHFVLAKLEEKGLKPAPPADRATLIRRVSYDLIGLPPTAEEVDAFVADPAPDAYEKLVERLLASPRYGERWGRYWLDLARYSDTKGYAYAREERQFVHAYNYRDWVIRATNDDMPYDRFLRLQIAADQLGPNEAKLPDDLAAMGFLTVGRRFLGVVPDIIDDRIDVTIRTTLGLTAACARCHDHKFDPIPTADYYSLYGVFAGTSEKMVCLDPTPKPTEAYQAYAKGMQERTEKLTTTFNTRKEQLLARLRAQAGKYLAGLTTLSKRPDDNFYSQLGPDDLSPRILRQWQRYVLEHGKQFDPIWAPWTALSALKPAEFAEKSPAVLQSLLKDQDHRLNRKIAEAFASGAPTTIADVADIYGKVLTGIGVKWAELSKDPQVKVFPDADDEALRLVLFGPETPARVPPGSIADTEWFFDEGTRVVIDKLQAEIERWNINTPGAPPFALILEDRPEQHNPRVFKRGNPNTTGEEVTRHFLSLIAGENPPAFKTGSGRLELAQAIASSENPLTARVMANRVWLHHFGAGLVPTPSDFGNRSEPPSHPELLDWLAVQFMKEGWSIKKLHRLMLCSATYRQQSADNPTAALIDPENRLLWRMNRTRLDFESMRDSLLSAAGRLDLTTGGKPSDILGPRRTVYAKIDRQFVPGVARTFDFACPDLHIPQRAATTVPQQALFFMNSQFVTDQARALSDRTEIKGAKNDRERVERLFRIVYQRNPSASQMAAALAFIQNTPVSPKPEPTVPAPVVASAWSYGYGEHDPIDDRTSFTPLPYFTGAAWQGGPRWPDAKLGWVQLTATGGHSGNDLAHAAIRRWTAPADMTIRITGELRHETAAGKGIAARLISSRAGTLGQWKLHNAKAATNVESLTVKRGETIDFAVDFAGNLNNNMFTWAPVIEEVKPTGKSRSWTTTADFAIKDMPTTPAAPMNPWTVYAHVLLMSNEFMFVD